MYIEKESNNNYMFFSIIGHLRREWNTIFGLLNLLQLEIDWLYKRLGVTWRLSCTSWVQTVVGRF